MMDVIMDTSPLIFLSKIKRLDLLSRYKIIVPRQVEEEILKGYKRQHKDASLILKFLKNPNVTKVDVKAVKINNLYTLSAFWFDFIVPLTVKI